MAKAQQFDNYNFHQELIQDLGKKIFFVQNNLILATRKIKRFDFVRGELINLRDMVESLELRIAKKTLTKIDLYLKLSRIKADSSDLEEGSIFLRKAFINIVKTLKSNGFVFPKKFKSMTFKEYGLSITK